MKWSEEAWARAEGIYEKILELPFVRELADGSLSDERFRFYISQDALYISNYCRVLAHMAARLGNSAHSEDFLRFTLDGVLVERALHRSCFGSGGSAASPSPTCMLYINFESSKAHESVEVEAAAVLPCFQVYQRVGEDILRNCAADNPYRRWIDTYADEAFAISTRRAIEICDELAAGTTAEIRRAMTEAYVCATRMEWMFWDSAYNLEQWKI